MKLLMTFIAALFLHFTAVCSTDSLDIKIGQMIMMGLNGTSVDTGSAIYQQVAAGKIGGILLYERNIHPDNARQKLSELCNTLQQASSIPLLLSIDQEGGKVNRLKTKYGFEEMPSAYEVAQKNDDAYTNIIAERIATTCNSIGINVNYAPVLDLHNPDCPVLGKRERCFSSDPLEVAHIAAQYIDAHRKNQVLTVLKHFPGHGNSRSDSHLGIADVSKYWSEEELLPYEKLITQNKVDAIMTAHIINTQLDSDQLPATLSEKIITQKLRNEMGYNGVIITDDMQMGAISKYYGFEESIKMALLAGVDILMFSNNIAGANQYEAENIHTTIKNMVLSSQIPMSRIEESYNRIMKMKSTLK